MQFSVNSIEKVKLQYIHLYNFILNLYFKSLEKYTTSRSEKRRPYDRNSYWVYYEDYEYSDLRYIKSKVEE